MKKILMILTLLCFLFSIVSCNANDGAKIIYDVTPDLYQIEFDLQRTDTLPSFLYAGEKTVESKLFKTKKIEYLGTKYPFEYEYSIGDESYYSFNADDNISIKAGVNKKGDPFEFDIRIKDKSRSIPDNLTVNISENTSREDARREIERAFSDIDFSEYSNFTYQQYSDEAFTLIWYNEHNNCIYGMVSVTVRNDGFVEKIATSGNYDKMAVPERDLDFTIDTVHLDKLITERLSKMYNTKQMSYKSYEIEGQSFAPELKGVMCVYEGETYILYDLDVRFDGQLSEDSEKSEATNCCMLLIPIRLIEKQPSE